MNFSRTAIKELTLKVTKGTTPTTLGKEFKEEGVNFIKAEALNGDTHLLKSGISFIDEETHQMLKRSIIEENDTLVTIAGANIGKCGLATNEFLPANTNQAVAIIRPDKTKVDPLYFYYCFKNRKMFSYIQGLNAQAAQPNINLEMLGRIEIPVIDRAKQEQISTSIWKIDSLINTNEKIIQKLEESARLIYKEWFVHFRYPCYEKIKIKDGVPEGWCKGKLQDLVFLNYGKALKAENRIDGVYPVYGSSGVVGTHEKYLVEGPAIIVGRKGNVGSCFWSNENFHPIDTVYYIEKEKSNFFIYHLIKGTTFQNNDAAVPGLNRDIAHSLKVLIPPSELILKYIAQVTPIFDLKINLEQQNKKLVSARDLLLPRLMNGELEL